MARQRRSRAMQLVAAALITGCGGTASSRLIGSNGPGPDAGTTPECATGNERCACYGNDTCNADLTCASGLCVRLKGSGAGRSGADAGYIPDASRAEAGSDLGGRGSGGAHLGAGGAPASGGAKPMGGAVSSGGHTPNGGGGSGNVIGSGGVGANAGAGGEQCLTGEKFCSGACRQPSPLVGCGLTGCEACALTMPANGYVTCVNGQCITDCLSGYTKNGDQCVLPGGAGGARNCGGSPCPDCGPVFGPGCCTSAGKCGCPAIPSTPSTCA